MIASITSELKIIYNLLLKHPHVLFISLFLILIAIFYLSYVFNNLSYVNYEYSNVIKNENLTQKDKLTLYMANSSFQLGFVAFTFAFVGYTIKFILDSLDLRKKVIDDLNNQPPVKNVVYEDNPEIYARP